MGDEQQPVVLVGGEGLLEPALAAEGEPAPADAVERVPLAHQLDQPLADAVVEHRDEQRQPFRRHPFLDQRAGQAAHPTGQRGQRLDVARQADLQRQFAEPEPLQREQGPLGDDADQPVLVGDQHVPDPVLDHQQRRFVRRCVRRQGQRLGDHQPGDRLVEVEVRHRPQQVALGEHAERPAVTVDDDDGADMGFVHPLQGGADGEGLIADHRLAAQQGAQRLRQRLLFGHQAAFEPVVGTAFQRRHGVAGISIAVASGRWHARPRAPGPASRCRARPAAAPGAGTRRR